MLRSLQVIMFLVICCLLLSCEQQLPQTKSEILYFILIDRFADGDPSNNEGYVAESYLPYDGSNPTALNHYQGGDLPGITQNLDKLKDLGITMIWISPFLDNSNTDYVGWWPYHGYHPIDFYGVDEHFGSLPDLKHLVAQAHDRDMKIIFDMPFNQTAPDHPWLDDAAKQDWFHFDDSGKPLEITDWFDQQQIEIGELHGLPDLAQENPEVRDYLIQVSKYWIEETGCDGFRLDAVKHIPMDFWREYNAEIKRFAGSDFILLGEVFWGEAERIAPYKDMGFDLLFDIPGYYAIRNTFSKGSPMQDFSRFYWETEKLLDGKPLATLIDNHDVARFSVGLGDSAWERQLLALGWLMARPGLPVIYYGTEIGMPGYPVISDAGKPQDYLNRLPYPDSLTSEENIRSLQFQQLANLRKEYPALFDGDFFELYMDWSIYAFLRTTAQEKLLVVINNASSDEFVQIPIPEDSNPGELSRIYGDAVIRLEEGSWWSRLPSMSLSVWEVNGIETDGLKKQADFTDRLSKDYQQVILYAMDPDHKIETLQLAGDFNNWTATDYSNFRSQDTLFVTLPLRPGNYLYKFVVNESEWIANPEASGFVTDPYGGQNSLLKVLAD